MGFGIWNLNALFANFERKLRKMQFETAKNIIFCRFFLSQKIIVKKISIVESKFKPVSNFIIVSSEKFGFIWIVIRFVSNDGVNYDSNSSPFLNRKCRVFLIETSGVFGFTVKNLTH
jgi:hypothetical protein